MPTTIMTKSNKSSKKENKLYGHGDLDIIFMLKYSKNKKKLATNLARLYWNKMSSTQRAAVGYYLSWFQRWKLINHNYDL